MLNEISMLNRVAVGDAIRRTAWLSPEKEIIVDGDQRYTYKNLYEDTNKFANFLLDKGIQKGDTVATICLNSYEHIVAMYGIQKAAAVWVPLNAGLLSSDFEYVFNEVNIKLVVVDQMLYQAHEALLSNYDCLIITDDVHPHSFTKAIANESTTEPVVEIADRDIAHIMFTSGTTSNPKGVMTSHLSVHLAALSNIIELGFDRSLSTIGAMPFFHCAQHTFIHVCVILGAKITVLRKFDPVTFLQIVQQERVNFTFLLPMMYRAIVAQPTLKEYDIRSLKNCLYAMAPMDQVTLKALEEDLGVKCWLASGQTEIYPATVFFRPEHHATKKGSYWGSPSLVNDLAIMDDAGNILPNGQIGEIVHRGPNVMIGYLNNEQATKEARAYDWHHTGDLGFLDEDNLLVFVDRKKDMIKTGGENVASIHVEQILINSPIVQNCVVVGLPHPKWSEAVTAFVILTEDGSKEELIAYCREHLAGYQVPKEIVVVDEFPMTTTGKIQKHVLRSRYTTLYNKTGETV